MLLEFLLAFIWLITNLTGQCSTFRNQFRIFSTYVTSFILTFSNFRFKISVKTQLWTPIFCLFIFFFPCKCLALQIFTIFAFINNLICAALVYIYPLFSLFYLILFTFFFSFCRGTNFAFWTFSLTKILSFLALLFAGRGIWFSIFLPCVPFFFLTWFERRSLIRVIILIVNIFRIIFIIFIMIVTNRDNGWKKLFPKITINSYCQLFCYIPWHM